MSSPTFPILGVPCTLVVDGDGSRAVAERYVSGEGWSADATIKCAWDDRFTVLKGLLGGLLYTGRTITYLQPFSYPPLPALKCVSTGDITGLKYRTDQNTGWASYDSALIPAHFKVPTWDAIAGAGGQNEQSDPSGLPFTTTTFSASADIFQPPTGSYYYASGTYNTKPVQDSTIGLVRSHVQIKMTRHRMPFIPLDDIMNYDGTVNNAPIQFADRIFPTACLLFTGADTSEPTNDPGTGERCWDITFNFLGNYNITWNEVLDPSGNWVAVNDKSDGTGAAPYEEVDFSVLFGTEF